MEVSGQLHAPAALPSRKEILVPTGQEADWGPRASLNAGVREKIPSSYRDSNPRSSSPQFTIVHKLKIWDQTSW